MVSENDARTNIRASERRTSLAALAYLWSEGTIRERSTLSTPIYPEEFEALTAGPCPYSPVTILSHGPYMVGGICKDSYLTRVRRDGRYCVN